MKLVVILSFLLIGCSSNILLPEGAIDCGVVEDISDLQYKPIIHCFTGNYQICTPAKITQAHTDHTETIVIEEMENDRCRMSVYRDDVKQTCYTAYINAIDNRYDLRFEDCI